jgi:MFS family permease
VTEERVAGPVVVATAAVGVTVAGVLPVYLVSILVVQLRADMGFGAATLGLLVAAFFGCSSLAAFATGRLGRDRGSTTVVRAAALLSSGAMLGIGLLADDTPALAAALVVAGLSNGFGQPATNALIAAAVPAERQGVVYGAKQAAIPLSTLLGGLAVPLLALPYGWRAVFLAAGGVGLLAAAGVPRTIPAVSAAAMQRSVAAGSFRLAPLLVLSLGLMVAAGTGNAVGTFFVASAVAAGEQPVTAGLLAALASGGGILTRIGLGVLADRRSARWLLIVVYLIAFGSVGHALLATQNRALLGPGIVIAYCSGWAWAGLANYAIARMHPDATARASGITQGGLALGAALGPLAFGAAVVHLSYSAAWAGAAACSLLAGAVVALGRLLLVRDRPQLMEAHRVRRRSVRR